jgi:DNA segregation ATPase FtsK/SpoIIIE, S-DNA-T family
VSAERHDDADRLAEVVHLPTGQTTPDDDAGGRGGQGGETGDDLAMPPPPATASRTEITPAETVRVVRPLPRAVAATRAVVTVVTHRHTQTVTKATVRNLWYPVAGLGVVIRRWRDTHGANRYERMMRQAELTGNLDMILEWEARDVAEKQRRHNRLMDWVKAPKELAKAIAIGIAALTGLLLVLGGILAIASKNAKDVVGPVVGMIDAVRWAVWFFAAYGTLLLLVATVSTLAYLWHVGRTHTDPPSWIAPKETVQEIGVVVTADAIVRALQHLSIPALNTAFKNSWTPRFDLTPTREGQGAFKGYRAIVDLPLGVPPSMVSDKREVLAKNLNRNPVEVWPSDYGKEKGGKAGYLNLYVADSGVMDKPTPDYPLLHEGTADVFEGVPVGIDQRGGLIVFPLVGSNFVFGGQPGQGKSNAVRVAMLGAALDPLAELRVHVFALNGDFDAYAPRLALYKKGATTEHAESATEHLHELKAEVGRREGRLAELGAKKLTRPMAERHPDMRPLVVAFSECHELFGSKDFGKEAADLATDVIKRGRKTGVILGFDTQSARKDAIPPRVVENVGINGCFYVKSWRSNDGFLGDGSFAAGIRATDLRFNVDRGTMVATGVSEELFEILRTFFVKVDDDTGWDQATEVIERAMTQLNPDTKAGHNPAAPRVADRRDLLEDLAEVIGVEPVPVADLPARLRDLAPGWPPYQSLTGKQVVSQLAARYDVKVPSTGNRYPVDPVTVREALARMATADLDDD